MGAGASTADHDLTFDDVEKWSKEEVGEQAAAIGPAFEKYRQVAFDNDVDGETLLDIDDAELAGRRRARFRGRRLRDCPASCRRDRPQPGLADF